jgi:hypothetical protein
MKLCQGSVLVEVGKVEFIIIIIIKTINCRWRASVMLTSHDLRFRYVIYFMFQLQQDVTFPNLRTNVLKFDADSVLETLFH